ncbi:RloB domain-containing protein [Candidatus Woesearchaeota archaeon]|nr:RloB domain-containing protein [Candidatus Woesearchaeota archaeon]
MVRKRGRKPTKALWIFCEGKTEKLYFDKLKFEERISRLRIKSFQSGYRNADDIVKEAADFISKVDFQKGDLIACVFDRDANSNEQLARAKATGENKDILISFSNPCFEYWILCHYGYFAGQYEQRDIIAEITSRITNYKKNDPDLYSKTKNKIQDAINNADKIKNKHTKEKTIILSRESNPLTLVFELVNIIDKFRN